MASKTEAEEKGDEVYQELTNSTPDEYLAICESVARTMGFKPSEREISQRVAVLKGKFRGKACTVVSPIPSRKVSPVILKTAIKSASRGKRHVLLLSPYSQDRTVTGDGSLSASRTGGEFLRAARKTQAFKNVRTRLQTGNGRGTGAEDRKLHDLLKRAARAYDAGEYGTAMKEVTEALSLDRAADRAHRLKGHLHLKLREYDSALQSFEAAAKLNPDSTDNLLGKASALYMLGRYDRELKCYEAVLRRNPRHREALLHRGETLHQMGKLREAVASYRKLLKVRKNDTEVMSNLAIALYGLGDASAAIRAIDGILAVDGDNVRALRMKGLILAEQGKEEALDYLRRYAGHESDQGVDEVIAALSQGALASGADAVTETYTDEPIVAEEPAELQQPTEEATETQQTGEAVAVIGETPVLSLTQRMYRAGLLSDRNNMLQAVTFLKDVGTIEAEESARLIWSRLTEGVVAENAGPGLMARLEKAAFDAGDYITAERIARRLDEMSPSASNRCRLVSDLALLERYDEALSLLGKRKTPISQAVRSSFLMMVGKVRGVFRIGSQVKSAAVLMANNVGMAIMESDGVAAASDYYATRSPDSAAMRNNRGVCFHLLDEMKRGLELFTRNAAAGRWEYLYNLGVSLLEMGRHAEATDAFRSSLSHRETGIARNSLGIALATLKDFDGARKEFEAALRADPPYRLAHRNLRRLARQSSSGTEL